MAVEDVEHSGKNATLLDAMQSRKAERRAGMELKLINPTQHVAELLKLTNLDSLFEILPSEDTVLRHAAFSQVSDDTAAYQID